jgi:hypothetical protein
MSGTHARRGTRYTIAAMVAVLVAAACWTVAPASSAPAGDTGVGAASAESPYFETAVVDLDDPAAVEPSSALPAEVHEPGATVVPSTTTDTIDAATADPSAPSATTDDTVATPEAPTTVAPEPLAADDDCVCPGWSRQVELPLEGEMVNITWSGDPGIGLQIRSRDGDDWSAWADAHLEPDEGPDAGTEGVDDGRHLLGPVWTGAGTDAVEIYLESGAPVELELEVLHSVEPEDWSLGQPTAAGAGQPPIFNRSQWGSGPWQSGNSGCAGGPFYASELRFGIVHHTVTTNDYQPWESDDIARAVYHGHTAGNGWCDIGYNFLVDKFGQIFEGRSMSLYGPVTGGHAKGFNSGSVGIALLGQYHPGSSPPAAGVTGSQLAATASVFAWKFDQYGVDPHGQTLEVSGGSTSIPAGQWVWLNNVSGHRDVGATGCPGNNAYNLLPQLRHEVRIRQVPTTFRDVPRDHPFYDDIEWMWRSQLTTGYPDGNFQPLSWVSRQATMTFLYRFAASPGGPFPNPGFSDVPTTHAFYKPIAWAVQRGITTGYPNGTFQGTMWVPRDALVAFMYRLASSPAGPFPNPGFRDVPTNHPFYKEIAWAKHTGVASGYADGTFKGGQPVTRQASAAFMHRYAGIF